MSGTYHDLSGFIAKFKKIRYLIELGNSIEEACALSGSTVSWYSAFIEKYPNMLSINEIKSIFPLFTISPNKESCDAHGSCCYVSLFDGIIKFERIFLVTAKHVIERIPEDHCLAIALDKKIVEIPKEDFCLSGSLDIAALPIDNYPSEHQIYSSLINSIPIDVSTIPQLISREFFFHICGWPAATYMGGADIVKYNEMFDLFSMPASRNGIAENLICLSHNRPRLTNVEREPVKSYVPEGVSGGACFAISFSDGHFSPSLQGIYIEYHSNTHLSFAVKIENVISFLNSIS